MDKCHQFFCRLFFLFIFSFPLLLIAQNKQGVKADLVGVDRRLMTADSLDQPQKAIELAQSLYNLASKSGNVGLQYKALSYELKNQNRLNPTDYSLYLDNYLDKTEMIRSTDYRAIGILYYLNSSRISYNEMNDSVKIKRMNILSEKLLKLLPECRDFAVADYNDILTVSSVAQSITPTLDLYLTAAWINRWKNNQMMNPELSKQFTAMLINSGKPAAAMWGKYMSIDGSDAENIRNERIKSLVAEYNNIPEVGVLYEQIYFNGKVKDEINWLEEYISRHPNTAYAALFRNRIANLKLPALTIDLPLQSPLKANTEMTIGNFQSQGFKLALEHKNEKKSLFFPLQIPVDYSRDTIRKILPPLRAGAWKIKADSSDSSTDLYISDLAYYTIGNTIYGINFNSGEPLKEAVVSFMDKNKTTFKMENGKLNVREFLDKNKLAYFPFMLKRRNELSAPMYISYSRDENEIPVENYEAKLITNKPIYRPGDSLRFKGWAWVATPFKLTVPEVQKLTVKLRNPNYKVVDSVTVMMNEFGTYDGRLQIPALGMNGYHLIETTLQYGDIKKTNRETVQVEAYQAPAFQVNLKSNQVQYNHSDSATILGKAISFNGLPVANQDVRYNADFVYLLRFISRGYNFNITGQTKTNENGDFSFSIPLSGVINDKFFAIRGLVTATVTNESGETQNGTCSFIVADRPYSLRISGNKFLDLSDQEATFEVSAQSPLKEKINTNGEWRLENSKGGKVKSGNWIVDEKFELNLPAGFAVGRYKLICEAADSIKSQMDLLVFNSQSDEMPADTTLLLIPGKEKTLFVGTSEKEIHIRSIWKLGNKPAEEKWVKLKKGLHAWPLPEVGKGYNAQLTLITVKNQKIYSQEFTVDNPIIPDSIQLTVGTFRDHLTPGAKETWNMTLSKNGQPINSASTLAFMYDEALNELAGFNPAIKPVFPSFNFRTRLNEGTCFKTDILNINTQPIRLNDTLLAATNLYFGFKEDRRYMVSNVMMVGSARIRGMATKSALPVFEESDANLEIKYIPNAGNEQTEGSSLRSNFADCAFFYPNLPVSNDGKVTFSFTLPDLITTWRFVAITNNEKMEVGQIQQSFVAQKELMLQINEPRFLRQGDQTEIEATVSFLKPHSGATTVTMELVDATTEKVISSTEKQISGSEQVLKVNFPLAVPANTDRIILRMRATNGKFSDGEQYLIPVLSPDIELTQTLELNTGGNSDRKFQWKALNQKELIQSNSKFRIEMVKNPAWYTINALSALLNPNSASSDALINAYFANTLGEAIAKANPDIETYLIEKAKSPLSGKVANTPWVNEEEQETKQIQQALLLYNPGQIEYLRSSAFTKLKQLQNEDGGFAWYPGMRSSLWQTLTVLQRMGELTELGVIEYGQVEKMMQIDALKYIDKYIADTYLNEIKYKTTDKPLNSTQALILYVRAMYMDIPLTGETLKGHKNWTSRASKSWIGNDLYTKSLLANALFAYGFTNEAKEIVTSILNYGVASPTLGFWFPSNQSDKLQTQVAMMRLMLNRQVNQPTRFEQMKWWLIAQKQNRMWPTSATTVDAVYALTMQGTNVLNTNGTLTVMLGNKELKSLDTMILSQNIAVADLIGANGEIRVVNQTPLPVFGALYRTFQAPVKSVKGNNSGALQIQKEIIRSSKSTLKVGEEVTVRLTVKSSQSLDFVQIKDQLAACYQPVDQKSGYSWMQVACYKELTNESINFFIETLPRGTTVFEYKVWINRPGAYQSGVAKIESVYNPQFTNYSDNCELEVK